MTDDRLDLSLFDFDDQDDDQGQPGDTQERITMPVSVGDLADSNAGPKSSLVLESGPQDSDHKITRAHLAVQDDVHSRVTKPVNVRDVFDERLMSMEESSASSSEMLSQAILVLALGDISGRIPMMSVNHAERCSTWGAGVGEDKIKRVGWVRDGMLQFVTSDREEYAVDLNGASVSAVEHGESLSLIGFEHGELYCLDHNTQVMECIYTQTQQCAITAICYFESYHSCFFVTEPGAVYVCKSVNEPNQVKKLKRAVLPYTKLLSFNHATKEFIWFGSDGWLYCGDLKRSQRKLFPAKNLLRTRFSRDGSLLYTIDADARLCVYRWDTQPHCLFEKSLDHKMVELLVSEAGEAYGLFVEDNELYLDRLS